MTEEHWNLINRDREYHYLCYESLAEGKSPERTITVASLRSTPEEASPADTSEIVRKLGFEDLYQVFLFPKLKTPNGEHNWDSEEYPTEYFYWNARDIAGRSDCIVLAYPGDNDSIISSRIRERSELFRSLVMSANPKANFFTFGPIPLTGWPKPFAELSKADTLKPLGELNLI